MKNCKDMLCDLIKIKLKSVFNDISLDFTEKLSLAAIILREDL